MDPFQLTEDAIFDIDAIWIYLREKEGVETAELTDIPNSGHRRTDLTSRNKEVASAVPSATSLSVTASPLALPEQPAAAPRLLRVLLP